MSINEELWAVFQKKLPLYDRLSSSLVVAIKGFLQSENIPFLDITSRVKGFDSACEKSVRKDYSEPSTEIEDWCGIRIICYYASDVERICEILRSELYIHSEENTANRLDPNEFGYRSTHLISSISQSWLQAPQYRGLDGLKAEIQVRTILMHAWAEIEHKLAYKNEQQVPSQFKRKLYRLSAKFEEADEQFEELREDISTYRDSFVTEAKTDLRSFINKELDLESFKAFLDVAYPDRQARPKNTPTLLAEIQSLNLSMAELIEAIEKQSTIFDKLEEFNGGEFTWSKEGALRNALDTANETYFNSRTRMFGGNRESDWKNQVMYGKKLLEQLEGNSGAIKKSQKKLR